MGPGPGLIQNFIFKWNISTTTGEIDVKFDLSINVTLRINCNNFGDPLTYYVVPPSGQNMLTKYLQTSLDFPQSHLYFMFHANKQMLNKCECGL